MSLSEVSLHKVKPTSPGLRNRTWFPHGTFNSLGRVKKLSKSIKSSSGTNNVGKKTVLGKKNYRKKYSFFFTRDFFFNNCKKILLTPLGYSKETHTLKPFSVWKTNTGFFFNTNGNLEGKLMEGLRLPHTIVEPRLVFKKGFDFRLGEKGSQAGKNKKFASANGTFFTVIAKNPSFLTVRLPSKKIRFFDIDAYYRSGPNLFQKKKNLVYGSAGFNFFINSKKSKVRGVAKNPVDHPHGGGEGKKSGKKKSPQGWVNALRHNRKKLHL